MTSLDLVHKTIPEALRNTIMEYTIDDKSLETYSTLIVLILNSKSIDGKEEKQSWFSLLPVMDEWQIWKLYDILNREQEKLLEIEQKYEEKKTSVLKKYTDKTYSNPLYKNTINTIKEKESLINQKDDEEADKLLENI